MCHPNADLYRDLSPKQIYRIHENEKKQKYNCRVTELEQGTFTALVFTTTGGMADVAKERATTTRHQPIVLCASFQDGGQGNFETASEGYFQGQKQQNRDREHTFVMQNTFHDS